MLLSLNLLRETTPVFRLLFTNWEEKGCKKDQFSNISVSLPIQIGFQVRMLPPLDLDVCHKLLHSPHLRSRQDQASLLESPWVEK